MRKCPKCGHDLTDTAALACPVCGSRIFAPPGARLWIGALFQFAIAATFILVFGLPKIMLAFFGIFILIAMVLSKLVKARTDAGRRIPPRPVIRPTLFRVLSFGIALCSIVFFSILLFGVVSFMNSWTRWHRYEGQRYHRSEFQVTRAYWQRNGKSYSVYASGIVESNREWMSLTPYLHATPRSQAELDDLVPAGTSIPIYLFPDLKGRARVQVVEDAPPAEASRRAAMNTLNHGLPSLAVAAGIIFVLSRLRRSCFAENTQELQQVGAGQIGIEQIGTGQIGIEQSR